VAAAGTASVTVMSPGPGGGTSNVPSFKSPAPLANSEAFYEIAIAEISELGKTGGDRLLRGVFRPHRNKRTNASQGFDGKNA
jgi:hypothetical protein